MKYDLKNIDKIRTLYQQVVTRVETDLSIPIGFLTELLDEDDWSFIIKIHAIIESAITNHLSSHLDPKLIPIFGRLDLSDSRIGKIVFAETLELLTSEQRQFIQKLSEVRNMVVHDIKQTSFTLHDFLRNLDANQRKSFINAIISFTSTPESKKSWREYANKEPKNTIWVSTLILLIPTTTDTKYALFKKQITIDKANYFDATFGK